MERTNYQLDTDASAPDINDIMKDGLNFKDDASAIGKIPGTKIKRLRKKVTKVKTKRRGPEDGNIKTRKMDVLIVKKDG